MAFFKFSETNKQVISKMACFNFSATILLVALFISVPSLGESAPPTCLRTSKDFSIRDRKTKDQIKIVAGTLVEASSLDEKKAAYLFTLGSRQYLIPQSIVEEAPIDLCAKDKVEGFLKRNYTIIVFAGSFSNSSASSFGNIITSIPNPNSVSSLPNPIVEKVEKGSGSEFGVCLGTQIWKGKLNANYCGSYQTQKFKIIKRPNPTPPSDKIDLGSLSTETENYTYQILSGSIDVTGKLFSVKKHSVSAGGLISSNYYLADAKKFEFRTGSVFKAESNSISTGPAGVVVNGSLVLEYAYRFDPSSTIRNVAFRINYKLDGELGIRIGCAF